MNTKRRTTKAAATKKRAAKKTSASTRPHPLVVQLYDEERAILNEALAYLQSQGSRTTLSQMVRTMVHDVGLEGLKRQPIVR